MCRQRIGGLPISPASILRTTETDVCNDPRWLEFVARHPGALIYHHPGWLAALEREYGQKCLGLICEDEEGHVRAILPLFYSKGFPFKLGRSASNARFSSLPRTPVTGPLALDEPSMIAVLRHALELVHDKPGLQLKMKSHDRTLGKLVPELACVPWGCTYIEELPAQIEAPVWDEFCETVRLPRECGDCKECKRLRFGNAKKQHRVNWAVNKAVKLGLQVRAADCEADVVRWYPLYLEAMRHHAFPPRPERFFCDLWATLAPLGLMKLLIAERTEGRRNRMIAGSVFLRYGQTVFYAFTGCAHRDFHLHPHDILQLESIRDSCKNGYRWYDSAKRPTITVALSQFKGKWGTQAKPLYRYYYPAPMDGAESKPSHMVSLARQSWRSLPLRLTAKLGDQIHRYL